MDDIPSLSSGTVGSRFVSQADIDEAKSKRDEQWKAAYARLGQEPPERPAEDVYDGRSLAEVGHLVFTAAQQEEWEQKMKLSNQFRSLEEDEVVFLDSLREQQLEEERKLKELDGQEVRNFREAVAARQSDASKPPLDNGPKSKALTTSTTETAPRSRPKVVPIRKNQDKFKGVIVKKKTNPMKAKLESQPKPTDKITGELKEREAKRRRVDDGPEKVS
ncbi:N-terminal domain of NEFA-interacting nuclear protein NIP30-domain-containing protein [Hysterangium stoloniferum]|nr:N-terminal domain of NEFA-interacting nuclear protein NIP30-domain-containing protein [Hysterangium stoloniferum]